MEYAHELQVKFGLDIRLLLPVKTTPASALTVCDAKASDFKPTLADIALLELLVTGNAPKEMAETLGITVRAVRLRSQALREKLGVKSNEAMVAQALRQGLIK